MLDHETCFLFSTQDHPGGDIGMEISKSFDVAAAILSMEEVAKKIIAMKDDPRFVVDPKKEILPSFCLAIVCCATKWFLFCACLRTK